MPRNPLDMSQSQQGQQMGGPMPDINNLARPLTDALSQAGLPQVNQMTQQLGNTANQLGQNLQRTLSNVMPSANGNANPNANPNNNNNNPNNNRPIGGQS